MTAQNTHTYILSQNKEVKYFEVTLPSGELGYAYMLQPGAEFDLSGVQVAQMTLYDGEDKGEASGNLLLATDDGQPGIVIWNFKELADSANPPMIIMPDGSKVAASDLSQQLTNVFDIEPAAGPEAAPAAAGDNGFNQPDLLSTVYDAPGILSAVPGAAFADPAVVDLPTGDLLVPLAAPVPIIGSPPVAQPDAFVTPEDTAFTTSAAVLLANDSDPDGDPLTVIAVAPTSANGATITYNTVTGAVVYTPALNFNGVDTFNYTITDGNGNNAVGVVTVTVTPVNDAPDAVNDAVTTNEDTPVVITVLGNDTDPDGDPLTVTATTPPANGSVVINAGGTITYTPNANFNGVDTFTYTITDGNGGFDTATVNVTINPVNDAPDAVNDAVTTNEDTPVVITVLGNDTDPDGDPLTVTATTPPANGSVVINAGGTITYTPNANFNGVDSFTYTITDGNGGFDTATVTVTINPVDDPVDAVNDAATTAENTAVAINLLANDSAPDGGLAFVSNTAAANGTVTVNAAGVATYTPNAGFVGNDTFTYTVRDADGDLDTATVTVTVTNVDQPVDAVNDTAVTNEDVPVNISLLANDSAPDGGLAFVSNTNPANGTVTVNAATGVATYTPNANFNGVDTFTYTVRDADGDLDTATVTITVNPINDAPDAVNDAVTTNEDTPVTITVLGNDTDPDGDPLTVTGTTAPANGSVVVNAGGTITYTPNANFNGVDTFTYTITDGNGGFDTATVTVTVNPINDAPDAVNDAATTNENTPVTIAVLGNDTDPDGDPLTVTTTTNPANGTIVVNAGGTITYTPNAGYVGGDSFTYTITDGNGGFDTATVTITVANVNQPVDAVNDAATTNEDVPVNINLLGNDSAPDGGLAFVSNTNPANGTVTVNPATGVATYTPNANFNGVDTFTYTVRDADGDLDTATVTITVNPINDAPDAVNDSASTTAGTPVVISVLGNDTDPDGDPLTVVATTNPANGSIVVNANGTISYTPNASFTGTDTFTYTITDGQGGFDTATVTINVAAAPINHNVTLVLDTSSSMANAAVGAGGQTGFQLMKAAVVNLINTYQALGEPVTFTVINYAETASTTTFTLNNFAGVTNFVNALGQTGIQTFNDVALAAAQGHMAGVVASTPTSATQINEVFFVSDGFASSGHGIGLTAATNYQSFIGSNGIASHAVGIGNAVTGTYDLVDLDNTGSNFQQITSAGQLFTTGAQTGDFGAGTSVLGTGGNDVLSGNGGNDFINGGAGVDQNYGGAGFDTIIWDSADSVINGGSGVDTLKVSGDNSAINLSNSKFQQIERIDLENGVAGNQVILTSADVLRVSDDNIIAIKGDAGDNVSATGFGGKLGNVTGADGTVYGLYNDAGTGANLLVELGLNLNGAVVV